LLSLFGLSSFWNIAVHNCGTLGSNAWCKITHSSNRFNRKIWRKLKMLNLKQKRNFVCTLIAALLLSVAAASVANARDVDVPIPPTVDESGQASADTPNLIMTLDGNATAPDSQSEEPNLYQAQDNSNPVDDNSTRVIDQEDAMSGSEENNLIATQTSPDFSVLVAGCLSLLVAVAAVGTVTLVRKRRTDLKI
jgi:hypothetical protein